MSWKYGKPRTATHAYFLTPGLKRYLNAVRQEKDSLQQQTLIVRMIESTIETLRKHENARLIQGIRAMVSFLMEKQAKAHPEAAKKVSCRKGCSFCCHVRVETTLDEMRDVADAPIDEERLAKQIAAGGSVDAWEKQSWEDKACVFLKDGACSIYDKRPLACRLYHVASPPTGCDTRINPSGTVLNYQYNEAEMFVSAYFHFNSEQETTGSLPQMLKRAREEKK